MKGAVFIALNDMVEEVFGVEVWEAVLEQANPESEGIYISASSYTDAEIISLISAIADTTQNPIEEIIRNFGCYLFSQLNSKYPIFTESQSDFFGFLNSIHTVIHVEVNKLYEDASLPTIACERIDNNHILMHYRSPRKFCILAEGLIFGAANHYNKDVIITQGKCMSNGHDECEINIKIL